ncbi:MAG: hypothetical protein J3R72DRAFT_430865 [Linnemannia gamsii]|nr:MAG: hypothetical protein J3R72DRAFT_430865 [Linnemannia gamsii]
MTSQETKTHPELAIVTRILQQASIPLSTTQFDQQWTSTHLRTAFQWTRHLSALFLSFDDSISSSIGHVLTPQRIVKSFLKTHENNGRQLHSDTSRRYNDNQSPSSLSSSSRQLPTEEELLDSSIALQRRLLCNPGLTDMARVEILSLVCSPQQPGSLNSQSNGSSFDINRDALAIIKENALEDLIAGTRSHFLQLKQLPRADLPILHGITHYLLSLDLTVKKKGWQPGFLHHSRYSCRFAIDDTLSNMTAESIEQRTKARVLFDRIKTSNRPTSEVEMVLIPQLRKYLEVSRPEAWDVISFLSEMATEAIGGSSSASKGGVVKQGQVNWGSVVDALTRLQYE